MLNRLRDRIFTTIRGNADGEHGAIACLRCRWLENKRAELEAELIALENQATLHVAQNHIINEANKVTPLF